MRATELGEPGSRANQFSLHQEQREPIEESSVRADHSLRLPSDDMRGILAAWADLLGAAPRLRPSYAAQASRADAAGPPC